MASPWHDLPYRNADILQCSLANEVNDLCAHNPDQALNEFKPKLIYSAEVMSSLGGVELCMEQYTIKVMKNLVSHGNFNRSREKHVFISLKKF